MKDLSPAAYDALAHAVWGGLADAGIAYEHRYELAEVILDEMIGVFAEEGIALEGARKAIEFAFDASRREPAAAV
jgi:hypothetical protein